MSARTGEAFLKGLASRPRNVWIDGERIGDVTEHPLTKGAARSLARVFDRQHEFPDDCLAPHPDSGEPMNISHLIPQSHDDVRRRQRGLTRLSEVSVGIMGRTPDYMNMKFSGFASAPWVWAGKDGRHRHYADNLVAYQRYLAAQDVSLTHTIIQPTNDKRTDGQIVGNEVTIRKVAETEEGMVVRGARVLATLAPFADETAVYPALPLPAGAEDYAVSFAIPLDTPGLTFMCRDSMSSQVDPADRPLSARFDEQDAFCIFDDVLVPWDRVFINGDVDVYNSMQQTGYFVNMTTQSTTRALTKLEFAYGLATRMAEMIGDHSPATLDMLGELACYVQVTRSALELSVEHAAPREIDGAWFPDPLPLDPMRALLATWMPRVAEIITMIGSHHLLTTPTAVQFDDPELAPLIDETLYGADGTTARDRSDVFRLAWDFVGSALAGRGFLYERFYLTSATRNRQMLHMRLADRSRPNALVDDMLALGRQPL